jgi:hypothetical protein
MVDRVLCTWVVVSHWHVFSFATENLQVVACEASPDLSSGYKNDTVAHSASWNRLSPPAVFPSSIGPAPSASGGSTSAAPSTIVCGARPSGAFSCWR